MLATCMFHLSSVKSMHGLVKVRGIPIFFRMGSNLIPPPRVSTAFQPTWQLLLPSRSCAGDIALRVIG